MKRFIPKRIKNLIIKVITSNNETDDVADGLAIGVFVAILPIMGIQMYLSFVLTSLFRKNTWVALIAAWITNPFTAVPIYWFNLWVGNFFYKKPVSIAELKSVVLSLDFHNILSAGKDILIPLWLGSVIVGILFAFISQQLCYRYYDHVKAFFHDLLYQEIKLHLLKKKNDAEKKNKQS
jgi:uncharacterized protein